MSRLRLSHAGVRRLRRATQGLAFAGFTLLVVYTLRDVHPPLPADTLVRLDPLAGLAAMLAGRAWLGRFLPAVVLLGATVALGRFWCGWLCPLGTLIEWTSPRAGRAKVAAGWRRLKYVLLFLILASALWGVLTLLILDPVTLFIRGVGTVALPALTWLVTALEGALYRFPALRGGLMAFDGAIRGTFLTYEQTYTAGILGIAALLGAILLANRLAPRAWCRYGCPLGALLGLVAKAPGLKRRVGETCVSCGACARSCPMGTVDGAQGYASDSAECTLCLECAVRCPRTPSPLAPSRVRSGAGAMSQAAGTPSGPWASVWWGWGWSVPTQRPTIPTRASCARRGWKMRRRSWPPACAAANACGPAPPTACRPASRKRGSPVCGRRSWCRGWGPASTPARPAGNTAPRGPSRA